MAEPNPVVAVGMKKLDGTTFVLNAPTYTDVTLLSLNGLVVKADVAPNGDGSGRTHRFAIDLPGGGSLVVDEKRLTRLTVGGFVFDFWPNPNPDRVDFYAIAHPADLSAATGPLVAIPTETLPVETGSTATP